MESENGGADFGPWPLVAILIVLVPILARLAGLL